MENREVDESDDAEPEEKTVSLQVSDLQEPQQKAAAPDAAAQPADDCAIQDPAVDERANRREQALRCSDEQGVKLIEVKPLSEK